MTMANTLREFWNIFFRDTRNGAERLCMHLLPRQQLRLRDAESWTVECCSGIVWITQEADARDILLSAGERFTLDRDGKTLVSGMGEAVLTVRPPRSGRGLRSAPDAAPRSRSARAVWLNALYPETGPWNDPGVVSSGGLAVNRLAPSAPAAPAGTVELFTVSGRNTRTFGGPESGVTTVYV